MRVFVVSHTYYPEHSAFASDVAVALAARGHEVTVFAPFPNRPQGRVFSGYRRAWRDVRNERGCRVIRSWHTLSRSSTMSSRFGENITFGLTSSIQLFGQLFNGHRPDAVFMTTWPLFAQNLNSFVLWLRRVPVVSGVLDVYPESLVDKGMLKRGGLRARVMLALNRSHLRGCARVFTLAPGMVELLRRTRDLPPERLEFVSNYMDAAPFLAPNDGAAFRKQHGIPADAFVAMFAGALTLSAGLMLYVEAAEQLRDRPGIRLVLVGDGACRVDLEREIAERRLTNIQVVYPLRPAEVPGVQAAADVLLISLKGSMAHSAVPSKQVSYMLSGKPVAASVPAESYPARVLTESDSGFVLPPEDGAAVVRLLTELEHKRERLSRMGRNARAYALANFTRDSVLPKLVGIVEAAARC